MKDVNDRIELLAGLLQEFIRHHTIERPHETKEQVRDWFLWLIDDGDPSGSWRGTHCKDEGAFNILFDACWERCHRVN